MRPVTPDYRQYTDFDPASQPQPRENLRCKSFIEINFCRRFFRPFVPPPIRPPEAGFQPAGARPSGGKSLPYRPVLGALELP